MGLVLPSVGISGSGFFLVDIGPDVGEFDVQGDEFFLAVGDFVFGLDGIDGAFGFAEGAVDAFVGFDDEHVWAFVKAVDGADFDAIGVFAFDAGFGDDKGHAGSLF